MSLDADSIALVFPGQGAQSVGMGGWLLQHHRLARQTFDEASELLGYDLAKLCLDGPAARLDATEFSQPSLLVHSIAAVRVLCQQQPELISRVKAVAGLSLGEYSAVCFAGGLDFAAALRLVQQRGQAMQAAADAVDSGMASVIGLDSETVHQVCEQARIDGELLQPANLLCRGNIVVSGHRRSLQRLESVALQAGASKVIPLAVAGAFHTELMRPAAQRLQQAVEAAELCDLAMPVFSNVDAAAHHRGEDFRSLFVEQLVRPVRWEDSIRAMIDFGVNGVIEVGTGRVLRSTIKRINRKLPSDGFGDAPGG